MEFEILFKSLVVRTGCDLSLNLDKTMCQQDFFPPPKLTKDTPFQSI
jgi:hypothetical protein